MPVVKLNPKYLNDLNNLLPSLNKEEKIGAGKILKWLANNMETIPTQTLLNTLFAKFDIWSDTK